MLSLRCILPMVLATALPAMGWAQSEVPGTWAESLGEVALRLKRRERVLPTPPPRDQVDAYKAFGVVQARVQSDLAKEVGRSDSCPTLAALLLNHPASYEEELHLGRRVRPEAMQRMLQLECPESVQVAFFKLDQHSVKTEAERTVAWRILRESSSLGRYKGLFPDLVHHSVMLASKSYLYHVNRGREDMAIEPYFNAALQECLEAAARHCNREVLHNLRAASRLRFHPESKDILSNAIGEMRACPGLSKPARDTDQEADASGPQRSWLTPGDR